MKIKDIQIIARAMKLKPSKLNKAKLIHLIQKTEKNDECYATSAVIACEQYDCLWRTDCIKANKKLNINDA